MQDKMIVGSLELCSLPDIGIENVEVRVDTGARTSSLHVDNLEKFTKQDRSWVRFDIHPDVFDVDKMIHCETPLHDIRGVKSSNGKSEDRYVISTILRLGTEHWPIEITLTDRSNMSYLMLLGRTGMGERVLVDPSKTFLLASD